MGWDNTAWRRAAVQHRTVAQARLVLLGQLRADIVATAAAADSRSTRLSSEHTLRPDQKHDFSYVLRGFANLKLRLLVDFAVFQKRRVRRIFVHIKRFVAFAAY